MFEETFFAMIQNFRIFCLLPCLMLFFSLPCYSANFKETNGRFSIDVEQMELASFTYEVEELTGVKILYDTDMAEGEFFSIKNTYPDLSNLLKRVFSDYNTVSSYNVDGELISITIKGKKQNTRIAYNTTNKKTYSKGYGKSQNSSLAPPITIDSKVVYDVQLKTPTDLNMASPSLSETVSDPDIDHTSPAPAIDLYPNEPFISAPVEPEVVDS